MANTGILSSHFILRLLCLLLHMNSFRAYSLKNCTKTYQENLSAHVVLDCSNRNLENIPDDPPKEAVSLKLNRNLLQKINKKDFCGMSKLRIVNLEDNKIVFVDDGSFTDLSLLETLVISNNKLTNLTSNMFQGLSNLTVLDLSYNKIYFINNSAFQFLSNLQSLDLSENMLQQITKIQPILQLPQIQRLALTSNQFSSFETKDLPLNLSSSLKELSIYNFEVKNFSITTPIFPYLTKLDLSGYGLQAHIKWDIPDKTFLRNITQLYFRQQLLSLEEMQKVLQSFSSLRHLRFGLSDELMTERLFLTVCKIPSLRRLDLFDNNLDNLTRQLSRCSQLTELDLSSTGITELQKGCISSMTHLWSLNMSFNLLVNVPYDVRRLPSLKILNLNSNRIFELTCEAFLNATHLTELSLSDNRIAKLDKCVLEHLTDLKLLDLSKNLLKKYGNIFSVALQKLEVLDLAYTGNSFLKFCDFQTLESLKQMKAGMYFFGRGKDKKNHGWNNANNKSNYNGLQSLENLTIILNVESTFKNFHSNYGKFIFLLKSLKILTVVCNVDHSGIPFDVPIDMLRTMEHLEYFTAINVYAYPLDVKTFQFNPRLKSLTLAKTDLSKQNPELFLSIPNLQILDLSRSELKSLNFLVHANLTALRYLKLTNNEINVINEVVFSFLPSLTYLDLSFNQFTCECSNAGFIQWIKDNKQTQVVNAHQYKCSFPVDKQGTLLLDFDVQSCWNDGNFFYFVSSSCLVVLALLTSFIYHFLRWQLAYTFHLFMAFLYDSKMRKKGDPHQFDAFVSYNVHDEDWVYREMLPVLEGEQGWRLCLHHRDFQPGKPIMENITDAIYGSRKTICVISRHYLQSEWCSREIQMASFRLFDEQKDVLILLFLEEIPPHYLSPYYRMRKLVKKRTYLSWPQAAQHPGVFWQNVQRALQTGDALTEDTDLLTGPTGHMAAVGSSSSRFVLKLLFLLIHFVPSLTFSLKDCNIDYQENPSSDVSLNCQERKLTAVPEEIPQNAVSIQLSHNLLEEINKEDFCGFLNLRILNLGSNQIVSVEDESFFSLVSLKTLSMSFNQLTKLTSGVFKGLSNLTVLNLNSNSIQFLHNSAFQFLISLQTLDLGCNLLQQISDLQPILQLPQIQTLNLESNNFSSFETKDLLLNISNLKELQLPSDTLKVFSITTPVFPYLEMITFDTCGFCSNLEWDIPDKTLLRSITQLCIAGSVLSFEGAQRVLQSLDSLTHLTLYPLDNWLKNGIFSTICKIPTLRKLDLSGNILYNLTFKLAPCSQLTEIDLSNSWVTEMPKGSIQSMKQLRSLNVSENRLVEVPVDIRSLSSLEILNMNNNRISELNCEDFRGAIHLRELSLNSNRIIHIDKCVAEHLTDLRLLDLGNNHITDYDDCFEIALQNLEILDLSYNVIFYHEAEEFQALESLKYLTVGTYFIMQAKQNDHGSNGLDVFLSHEHDYEAAFRGLQHLESLTVYLYADNVFKIPHATNDENYFHFQSLKTFTVICRGDRQGASFDIPQQMLNAMENLEVLKAVNIYNEAPHRETFDYNPHITNLTLTKSNLKDMDPRIFVTIPKLQSLDLSETNLISLDFPLQANLTALRYLKVTDNEINVINESVFQFLPSLTYLDLDNNPFTCECSNSGFIQWIKENKQIQVVNAHQYKCSFPVDKRGTLLLDFHVQSCWNDGSFFYFISSSCLVVLTLLTSFVYHFLKWQLAYTFHLFLAFLYDSRRKKGDPHQFDAFVSYNVHNEDWVYREMLPVLEGEQGWRLCLHHRDFQPGKPIMENITDAIYGSRKTICVISRHYLQSEWCSREIQMASFRLFDEQKDVLILLFLEEIPPHHLSPYYRLRKLVKKRTYLSWPQAAQHPGVFWQNVQRALQTGDALTEDTDLLTGPTVF
ncbi:uncharacterized protein LOC119425504 [Nematolebias whitei]|uniref:uncharacterized protein LOC119425504 n=1 Tax=Nematolebias whitei TaxID=451745 RepID=UPI0018988C22|nr:uncharacterized protein LOC119425504 [Nematolebias whitei]